MPARIKFELSQASHHARATHSQPASAHARKKPTHNSRSLTLLTSLPTGLDLALGKEVKNLNLLDLSVVGHPRFSVRLLVGLSAVTLPHYNSHHSTTSSTLLLPPLSPRCRSTAPTRRKELRILNYHMVEARLHARGLAVEGRQQSRRRNPHPNPIPARPRPLLPPRRCAPRKGAGGDLPLSAASRSNRRLPHALPARFPLVCRRNELEPPGQAPPAQPAPVCSFRPQAPLAPPAPPPTPAEGPCTEGLARA